MSLDDLSDDKIDDAERKVEGFLSSHIPVIDVSSVRAEEVDARTTIGSDLKEQLPEFSIYIRIKTKPVEEFDIIDTRGDVHGHIRHLLEVMEMNTSAPDTRLVSSDHPPRSLKKPLVFYVESTL